MTTTNNITARFDHNEIRIDLRTIEQCDAVIETGVPILVEFASKRKEKLIKSEIMFNKYSEWWNHTITPIINNELSTDDLFKYSLVMQELRMWIQICELVDDEEIKWMVDRRGFNKKMEAILLEGLKHIELYIPVKPVNTVSKEDYDRQIKEA